MADDALYSITREATHLGVHQDDDRRNSFRNNGPGLGYGPAIPSVSDLRLKRLYFLVFTKFQLTPQNSKEHF